jgi:hypothetical protein
MKLYRTKVPTIAHDVLEALVHDNEIEIDTANRPEAERDLVAIMEDYLRRDNDFRNTVRDHMARRNIPYDQRGSVTKTMAESSGHPMGEDVVKFLARQFCESLMISPNVDEVFGEDQVIYRKVIAVIRSHDVDEREIRDEAESKIKNVKEGTVDYEIALQNAMRDVRRRRGLS